jgi:CMP-N-acetylneuraminic acid synthetase
LVAHTIEAAKKSKYLDYFVVSTNSLAITSIAKRHKASVPFRQPARLATDKANIMDVMNYAIDWLNKRERRLFDYLVILQPTSPLRTAKDIDDSIRLVVDGKADSVMGMVKLSDFSVKKLKLIKGKRILPLVKKEGRQSSKRQSLPDIYKRNAAIYTTKISFIKKNDLFGRKSLAHIMPPERSVDINSDIDFEFAEFLMKKRKNGKKKN